MAADGADHELIEDNVVEGSSHGYPYITLILRRRLDHPPQHLRRRRLRASTSGCGVLRLGSMTGYPAGRGTVIEDNILSEIVDRGRDHLRRALAQPAGRTTAPGSGRDQGTADVHGWRDADELRRLQAGTRARSAKARPAMVWTSGRGSNLPRRIARPRQLRPGQAKVKKAKGRSARPSAECTGQTGTSRRQRRRASCARRSEEAQGLRQEGRSGRAADGGLRSGSAGRRRCARCPYACSAALVESVVDAGLPLVAPSGASAADPVEEDHRPHQSTNTPRPAIRVLSRVPRVLTRLASTGPAARSDPGPVRLSRIGRRASAASPSCSRRVSPRPLGRRPGGDRDHRHLRVVECHRDNPGLPGRATSIACSRAAWRPPAG